ncbi:STP1 protein [Plasmodium ovale wallikeri]|uniref:STP1 protein n=1 Tax=Plasmodium ovale wallikeri TaxID=864142 RepID=A0A1A9AI84_PLAOA|nr:STP1 protein [Plasmodium ovale wallikeri]
MADDSEITTLTHYIPVDFFKGMIESDIKELIHTYGHKDCGLRHEELCDKIKKIIVQKKPQILRLMDNTGKATFNREWDSKRNGFFNQLFEGEGFINMCYPFKKIGNPSLYKLKSRHIQFCKEKGVKREAVEANPVHDECVKYNSWINTETTSFTLEYLKNVKHYKLPNVIKYFSTKEHPIGHDPLETYRNSKLDCKEYNPPSRSHSHKSVAKASPDSPHPPRAPNIGKESQKKDGRSIPSGDGGIKKNKSDVEILHQTESSSSDTQKSPQSNMKEDGTDNGQNADFKTKGTVSPNNNQGVTGQPTEATDTQTKTPEQLPEPTGSISSKDSYAATVPDPPSVIKGQDTGSDATPITTSATSDTTHSIQNVPSHSAPDLSLVQSELQPQPPDVAPVTANNSKEPTPDLGIKSPDPDTPPTTALNPGLASVPEAASNSSASGTSPTMVSTTTDSTAGSPPAHDSLLITVPSQSTTTAVSSIGTQSISSITGNASTIEESKKAKASLKTISDPQDSTYLSPKKHDDSTPPSIGAQSPGPPADPLVDTPHGPQLPAPPSIPPFQLPTLSSGLSPDASHVLHTAVTRPDSPNIKVSQRDGPRQSKDTVQASSTPLPKVTYPIENPSIAPTEFPSLMNIIPTTLILLATLTILFLLYKYTPFGLFLGRRRRKKKDLRTVFEIPEESTYESSNEAIHEWDDHLGRQIMENDVYVKLLKINRYKKEMQKKKKKRDTTLIEVHMEIVEECKNDEWELHKGDFLEICLQEFINEKNRTAENWRNAELTVNNTKTDKIIQDAEENEMLWNFWMDNYRNILESWKSEEWFQSLKNEWKKERQKNHNKIDEIEENTLKESGMISIECEKDIWKKWISKQATLIENFKQKDWFKSLIEEQANVHIQILQKECFKPAL